MRKNLFLPHSVPATLCTSLDRKGLLPITKAPIETSTPACTGDRPGFALSWRKLQLQLHHLGTVARRRGARLLLPDVRDGLRSRACHAEGTELRYACAVWQSDHNKDETVSESVLVQPFTAYAATPSALACRG
eukprot:6198217-Pleurochrysis_carterae.AAC.2